jgi:hypothetical protein
MKLIKRLSLAVSLINCTKLPLTGVYCKSLRITDGNRETCLQLVTLRCVDLHRLNVVPAMPCTMAARPVFHWNSCKWMYELDNDCLTASILAPQAFYASVRKSGAKMYSVFHSTIM